MKEIFERRSIRKYTAEPVSLEYEEKLLRAAMQAPSAGNEQPWEFIVVRDPETLKKMTEWMDETHPDLPIVYGGGVMSNRYLQGVLSQRKNTYFAAPEFSADNAAGIALLTRRAHLARTGE